MRTVRSSRCLLAASLFLASGLPASSADVGPPSLVAFDRALDGSGRIHVIAPDGGGDRIITSQPGFAAPTWSPGGRTLVYRSGRVSAR